jgi:hypothetical protein
MRSFTLQSRFRNTQHASGGGKATAINNLNKVEEIVQVKHGASSISLDAELEEWRLFGRLSSSYLAAVLWPTNAVGRNLASHCRRESCPTRSAPTSRLHLKTPR